MPSRKPDPHPYEPDRDWPGYCRCHLPRTHQLHHPDKIAAHQRDQDARRQQVAAGQAWHLARTGEAD